MLVLVVTSSLVSDAQIRANRFPISRSSIDFELAHCKMDHQLHRGFHHPDLALDSNSSLADIEPGLTGLLLTGMFDFPKSY